MKIQIITVSFVLMFIFTCKAGAVDLGGIAVHGFISQGYLLSDENNYLGKSSDGSFQFNELGINFSKELTEDLRIGIQFFSRDLGNVGNNEVEIDWAYGDYRWQDWLGLRAGIIREVHGLYSETRDFDMLRTSILLPQSVYSELDRDFFTRLMGCGIYGNIFISKLGSISYNFMAGTQNLKEDGGSSQWVEASGLFDVDNWDVGVIYNGSLVWNTPLQGLRLSATGLKSTDMQQTLKTTVPLGPVPVGTKLTNDITDFYNYVFSGEYTWEQLTLTAEYMKEKLETEIPNFRTGVNRPEAYYFSATYRFTDWLEIGSYYSVYYIDEDDKDGDNFKNRGLPDFLGWQKDFAVSTRFDINEYWVFKLEGHLIDGAAQLLPQVNPDGREEDWFLFAAKMTFSF
ncbi:porin domain-containing protein [Desulfonema limicola]|uniref:Porin domain-containing protein n=1 Tax=Desulfonema limicola TaxID=45656 RepID=A0A975GK79_9BACT|nr:hypothetical protein [Desulfonema limicola]QTA83548.1 porin domain-containing protein [Desulfonema limicola]